MVEKLELVHDVMSAVDQTWSPAAMVAARAYSNSSCDCAAACCYCCYSQNTAKTMMGPWTPASVRFSTALASQADSLGFQSR